MDGVWAFVLATFTAMVLLAGGVVIAADSSDDEGAVEVDATESTAGAVVSTPSMIAVTDVVGLRLIDARAALREGLDKFPAVVAGVATSPEQIDTVIDQEPSAGTMVEVGAEVSLTMARRPEAPLVPRPATIAWSDVLSVDVVEANPGRCSVAVVSGTDARLDLVDCGEPHDFEYVAALPIADYPDADIVRDRLFESCGAAVSEYLLAPVESSSLWSTFVWPSQEQWTAGLTTADCLLMTPEIDSDQIVGSALGSLW